MRYYNSNENRRRKRTKKNKIANKSRFAFFTIIFVSLFLVAFSKLVLPKFTKKTNDKLVAQANPKTIYEEKLEEEKQSNEESGLNKKEDSSSASSENDQVYKKSLQEEIQRASEQKIKDPRGEYNFKLSSTLGEMTYYNQEDARWKDLKYGTSDPIGTHGCGPTVMAEIVSSFTQSKLNPKEMADWSYNNGYCAVGNGSLHSLIPEAARSFGLNVEELYHATAEDIQDRLRNGSVIVMVSGHGVFSDSDGHFIILRSINNDGTINIADSVREEHNKMKWDVQTLIAESSNISSAGGPFWAISR